MGDTTGSTVVGPRKLFVYFQVNTGVLCFLDYVEDIYIMVLSVLVSTLNLNHMYLPLLLTVYCIALYTYKLCTTILPLSVPCVPT